MSISSWPPNWEPETTAWLQYTGGPTGTPKGAMIPHRALMRLAQSVNCSWGLLERLVHLAASPITHAAVLPVPATPAGGGPVVLQQRFDARRPDHAAALARSSELRR